MSAISTVRLASRATDRTRLVAAVLTAAGALLATLAHASQLELPPADQLAGAEFDYVVKPGDYLIKIGARFGIAAKVIADSNGIPYEAPLTPGRVLRLDNRRIVPQTMEQGILINVPQRML